MDVPQELEKMRRRRRRRQPRPELVWLVVIVAVIGAFVAFKYGLKKAPPPVTKQVQVPAPQPAKPKPVSPPVKYPVVPEQAATPAQPLPLLDQSDASVLDGLTDVLGQPAVQQFLVNTDVIRNIVATVDNIPRQKIAIRIWPVKPTPGQFEVTRNGDTITVDPENASRYTPFMRLVASVDTEKLASLYLRYYPLFQQAYQDLGYPHGYFNDRLVKVIDHLLRTPAPRGPVALVQPSVYYKFADPAFEKLSAGQKILLRLGNQYEAIVKTKLQDFRKAIVRNAPARTARPFRQESLPRAVPVPRQ